MTSFPQVDKDSRKMVEDLFDWLVEPSLEFIRLECKMLIGTSPIHLVYTQMRLYRCLMDEIYASVDTPEGETPPMSASQVGDALVISFDETYCTSANVIFVNLLVSNN